MSALFSFFLSLPQLLQVLLPSFVAAFPNAAGGLTHAETVTNALAPVVTTLVTAAATAAGATPEVATAAASAATAHVATVVAAHPVVAANDAAVAQQSATTA